MKDNIGLASKYNNGFKHLFVYNNYQNTSVYDHHFIKKGFDIDNILSLSCLYSNDEILSSYVDGLYPISIQTSSVVCDMCLSIQSIE